jgi:hypothetical protein
MNSTTTMKNIQNSMLQLEIHYFPILSLIIFLGIGMCICLVNINSIYAQPEDSSNEEQKAGDNNKDSTTIKVKMNKNNLNISNHDRLKIVGYLNGEGQTKYVDLKEMDKDKLLSSNTTEKSLTVNLNFNQSNEISSVMVGDEYYICAYVLDDSEKSQIATDPIPLFDCMEGTIGKSTSAGTITLFPTIKKYGESKAFFTANPIAKNNNTTNDSKEIKITINIPIHDAKDIDDLNVVAMVKGEYQIKTIDVQKELKKGDGNDIISVPFAFERQTELGPIQPGDLFFGCATSDEFPDQNSKCEKRMLKDLDKVSKICARKDSSC